MKSREEKRNLETIPVGSLGVISLEGCRSLGQKIDYYLVKQKVSLWNQYAALTSTFSWMYAITA